MTDTDPKTSMHVYERARWKHLVRVIVFLFLVIIDVSLLFSTVNVHLRPTYVFTPTKFAAECILYLMVVFMHMMILPQVVFEADKVEITNDKLIMHNLLFPMEIPWSDVKGVIVPTYLKFAIIRTPRFFQLINKRDMDGFQNLIEAIQRRVPESAQSIESSK